MPVWVGTTKVYRYCVPWGVWCTWGLDGFSVNGFLSWRLDSNSTGQPRCRSCFSCKGTSICLATSSFSLASLNVQGCLLFRCSFSGIIIFICMEMTPSATDSPCLMWMSLCCLMFYCVKLVTSTLGVILSYCVRLTQIWHRLWKSNQGHIDGRWVLSPLCNHCSHWVQKRVRTS